MSLVSVIGGLWDPWEILVGPDGQLWATIRAKHAVLRIDPAIGWTAIFVSIDKYPPRENPGGSLAFSYRGQK